MMFCRDMHRLSQYGCMNTGISYGSALHCSGSSCPTYSLVFSVSDTFTARCLDLRSTNVSVCACQTPFDYLRVSQGEDMIDPRLEELHEKIRVCCSALHSLERVGCISRRFLKVVIKLTAATPQRTPRTTHSACRRPFGRAPAVYK
jgi:hypothetical protein